MFSSLSYTIDEVVISVPPRPCCCSRERDTVTNDIFCATAVSASSLRPSANHASSSRPNRSKTIRYGSCVSQELEFAEEATV